MFSKNSIGIPVLCLTAFTAIAGPTLAKEKLAAKPKAKAVAKPTAKAKAAPKVEEEKAPALSRWQQVHPDVKLKGLLDLRYARTDTDQGPTGAQVPTAGKTRYLGDGTKRRQMFRISQLTMDFEWTMSKKWTVYGQFALDAEKKVGRLTPQNFSNGGSLGIPFVQLEGQDIIGKNTLLRIGINSAPFMHEYNGEAGEPEYTITPSGTGALLTSASPGVEFEWHTKDKAANASVSLGLFTVLDNMVSPMTDPVFLGPAVWSFDDTVTDYRSTNDLDGKPGFYLVGTLTDKEEVWQVNLGMLDNNNDGLPEENGLGLQGFDTRLWSAAVKVKPRGDDWTALLQWMGGTVDWCEGATCTAAPNNKSGADLNAGNLLVSYKPKRTRYTVRYDWFATDLSGARGFNGTEEAGNAWTVAWRRDLKHHRDIGLEWIQVKNDPSFGPGLKAWDAKDNLLQASFRQFF